MVRLAQALNPKLGRRPAMFKRLTDRELLERIMSGVSDLQAAVAAVQSEQTALSTLIGTVITDIQAAIAAIAAFQAGGGLSDAAAEVLSQSLSAAVTSLQTSQ